MYLNEMFACVEDALADFLSQFSGLRVCSISLGVAGPICNGVVKITNSHWILNSKNVSNRFGCSVQFLNDFEAVSYGIATINPASLRVVKQGHLAETSVRVVLGPGTGLGEAVIAYVTFLSLSIDFLEQRMCCYSTI